jgi:hypothetical protein
MKDDIQGEVCAEMLIQDDLDLNSIQNVGLDP